MRGVEISGGPQGASREEKNLREFSMDADDFAKYVAEMSLLTFKPVLYACNVDEGSALRAMRLSTAFGLLPLLKEPSYL